MKPANNIDIDQPHVAIVILNWNCAAYTIECLESLNQISYQNFLIIILDNGSREDSFLEIKQYCYEKSKTNSMPIESLSENPSNTFFEYVIDPCPSKPVPCAAEPSYIPDKSIILIRSSCNLGFSGGNNIAMDFILEKITSDYILLLNNDTIVDKNFLTELVMAAEANPVAGFLGSKIYYYDYHGKTSIINFAGGAVDCIRGYTFAKYHDQNDLGQSDEIQEVDFVEGSCILLRTEMILEVGKFDPRFFAYWEEVDWCIRGKKAGWISLYIPDSKIWHRVSASSGGSMNPMRTYYMVRNMFIFMRKNASWIQMLFFLPYFIVIRFPRELLRFRTFGNRRQLLESYHHGFLDGIRFFIHPNRKMNVSEK